MKKNLTIKDLGICDYQETWGEMKKFTTSRTPSTPDEIWLLEHNQVFTMGITGEKKDIFYYSADEYPKYYKSLCIFPMSHPLQPGQKLKNLPYGLIQIDCYHKKRLDVERLRSIGGYLVHKLYDFFLSFHIIKHQKLNKPFPDPFNI